MSQLALHDGALMYFVMTAEKVAAQSASNTVATAQAADQNPASDGTGTTKAPSVARPAVAGHY